MSERDGPLGRVASHAGRWLNGLVWRWKSFFPYRWRLARDKLHLVQRTGPLAYLRIKRDFRRRFAQLHIETGGRVKRGRLEAFAETGSEGFHWSVYEDGKSGYEGLNTLDPGDRLLIFRHDGTIAFDGVIDPDREAGRRAYPLNPEYGQPRAFGCWIHWTQRGWEIEEWAALFFHGTIITEEHALLHPDNDRVPFRAMLIKSS